MTTILVSDEDRREDDNPDVFLGDVTCDACGRTVRISLEEGASAIMCPAPAGCGAKIEIDPDGAVLLQIIDRACTPEALALMDDVSNALTLVVTNLPPMLALVALAERLGSIGAVLGMDPASVASFVESTAGALDAAEEEEG